MLDKREESDDFGATRVTAHPILGDLPPVPLVEFTFDGIAVSGRDGEPIAAALIAAGYRVLRTMPRFGDARGGYCMIGRCTDCLVVVDGLPNVPACRTPVSAGQAVRTQHGLGETAWGEAGERGT
jgi:predicted molibdopterin-dependent oxidoreductase YjgC